MLSNQSDSTYAYISSHNVKNLEGIWEFFSPRKKWDYVGWLLYWHTTLTACDISGLVNVRYWSAPVRLLYKVGSANGMPSVMQIWEWGLDGVGAGLQFSIPAFLINFLVYLDWLTNKSPLYWY